ncbi:effector-associated constant component EACC1 [Sphaerisporangium aureirubrum]|uniref:Uncharacterized protein n=1 Tax=Sphaerisporangium aureirubrum TaxID=1544736 RepID=A0ABW1NEU5_9ACTN
MERVRLAITGDDADVATESLWEWLSGEPELRGRLTSSTASPRRDTMGVAVEFVVAVASGLGALNALSRSLVAWLREQRSDVTVEVTGPGENKVTLTAARIKPADAERMLERAFQLSQEEKNPDATR